MAYNSKNHDKIVEFIMAKYYEWKARHGDIPDTVFVRIELRNLGYPMSYSAFMKGYKHRGKNKNFNNKKQLSLF